MELGPTTEKAQITGLHLVIPIDTVEEDPDGNLHLVEGSGHSDFLGSGSVQKIHSTQEKLPRLDLANGRNVLEWEGFDSHKVLKYQTHESRSL